MKKLAKIREIKIRLQSGLCHYCGQPMWEDDLDVFRKRHGLTRKQAARLRCTAEHLTARCEGGRDTLDNIVAACHFCNTGRHKRRNPPPPGCYAALVRKRMEHGKWHGFRAVPL